MRDVFLPGLVRSGCPLRSTNNWSLSLTAVAWTWANDAPQFCFFCALRLSRTLV